MSDHHHTDDDQTESTPDDYAVTRRTALRAVGAGLGVTAGFGRSTGAASADQDTDPYAEIGGVDRTTVGQSVPFVQHGGDVDSGVYSKYEEGTIVRADWQFSSSGAEIARKSGDRVTHTFSKTGEYAVSLTVTDDEGNTASTTRTIEILPAEARADITLDVPDTAVAGDPVTLDASATAPDGTTIDSYSWDANGFDGYEQTVDHAFQVPGTHEVRLTVVDNDDVATFARQTIEVGDGGVPTVGTMDAEETVRQELQVVDESGRPVADEPVEFKVEDASIRYYEGIDTTYHQGTTGADGRIALVGRYRYETCVDATLTDRGLKTDLGCLRDGFASSEATVSLDAASESGLDERTFHIENVNSGNALDVKGESTANRADVIQWPFTGSDNQRWALSRNGDGSAHLENVNSGKLLEVVDAGTDDGDAVRQYEDTGHPCQDWVIAMNTDGTYRIVNVHSDKVVDIRNGTTTDGATAIQHDWTGRASQRFRFKPLTRN